MVKVIIDDIFGLLSDSNNKRIICYGSGGNFDEVLDKYNYTELADRIVAVIDGDKNLCGNTKVYNNKNYPIISIDKFIYGYSVKNVVLLITNYKYFMDIIGELDKYPVLSGVHVYVGSFLHVKYDNAKKINIRKTNKDCIPKIIHYCWFGGANIPQEYEEYIETWKIYCPNYEIIRWDENNYDVKKNRYMYEAYQEKKWAFVSDYARIDIINTYGGIYLDCDVELLQSWDDLLGNSLFAGFEDHNHIALGLGFGAVKGHKYLERLIDLYEDMLFRTERGLNLTACPVYQSSVARDMGFNMNNSLQTIDNMVLYPSNVFAPVSFWGMGEIDSSSHSIHHYKATWHTEEERKYIIEQQQRGKLLYQRYRQNEST